jgi:Mrp family chromosome partitioning ATPase
MKQWFRPSLPKACDQRLVQTLATHRADNAAINGVLADLAAKHRNVLIFDPTAALCPDGLCRSHDRDGKIIYRDRDHLNELGVLMLDGDLRHPGAHLALGLELRAGLPELLRGELGNDEAVQPTSIDGLFAVTGGACDYAAISALSRPDLARIIQGFRDSFDHVVIDAGSVLDVSDALMLGQQSDAVILSTMLDVSRVPQVAAAVERLRSVGVRLLGVIVHGVAVTPARRRSALPVSR